MTNFIIGITTGATLSVILMNQDPGIARIIQIIGTDNSTSTRLILECQRSEYDRIACIPEGSDNSADGTALSHVGPAQ